MTKEDFCAAVIGKPWVNRAEGPDAYDCWGLVLASFREIDGLELPQINGYASKSTKTQDAAMEALSTGAFKPCKPDEGAIFCVIDRYGNIEHVGRVLCGRVLHATSALGVRHDTMRAISQKYPTARFYKYHADYCASERSGRDCQAGNLPS